MVKSIAWVALPAKILKMFDDFYFKLINVCKLYYKITIQRSNIDFLVRCTIEYVEN